MFFIGVMGVGAKAEPSGYLNGVSCPVCGCAGPLHLARRYQYFHVFFIPLHKYDNHCFVTCPNCASVFDADGAADGCSPGQLRILQNNHRKRCPGCGAAADPGDAFCRRCGTTL